MSARIAASGDTIAAIATAPGRGGIGIIRLSGPHSLGIAEQLSGRELIPRVAQLAALRNHKEQDLDEAILLFYPQPASFTGEDVVELQCHGSPVQLQVILRECLALGARAAMPGEFSQRAFLNDKLDLIQAEAIADLIESSSEAAARGALRSLSGEFSQRVDALLEKLIGLRMFIEAAIDFPEEEIDFIADSDVISKLDALVAEIDATLTAARQGRALRDGIKVVLAGAPNAGKSSLLNQLAGQDTAIVTAIAGTTRDVLREHITIDGVPLHIVDTAGLREGSDDVEKEGIRRAREEMAAADRILLVIDDSCFETTPTPERLINDFASDLPRAVPVTIVFNKCDISGRQVAVENHGTNAAIILSARSGEGLSLLREHLLQVAGISDPAGVEFSARQRHINALEDTRQHITTARSQLANHKLAELVAEDLRYAQDSLSAITGQYSSDDLLSEIFSSFCIGK